MASLLDGNKLAKQLLEKVKIKINDSGITPGLAVIIVGEDPASRIYVNMKQNDCKKCGIYSEEVILNTLTTTEKLLAIIDELNERADIHGILCQLPLPKHIDAKRVIQAIAPEKDVDGFTYENIGKGMVGEAALASCTPLGIMKLLTANDIAVAGKEVVIINRSNIVGKPLAMMLTNRSATVTICHSQTAELHTHIKRADIIITAVGQKNFITAEMIKPDVVIVDVAMVRDETGKVCGDVDFAKVEPIASYITPVPGGVGPMTRAMLMQNTAMAAGVRL